MRDRTRTAAALDGAVLVRLRLTGPGDFDALPAVPGPRRCTVTVNLVDVATLPLVDLARRGYRVTAYANVRAASSPCADVLVPAPLVANDTWFTALVRMAERVYALDMGPVQRLFAGELAAHEAARAA